MWGDPAFVEPNRGDYHIGPASAAIDAGVDAGVTFDIDGDPRPLGGGFDIGADEFRPGPYVSVWKDAQPEPLQAGAPMTYTIRVANVGTGDLHATVTDILPAHILPGSTSAGH